MADTLAEVGHQAYTYAGSQGLTVSHVILMLDRNTVFCDARPVYTALSRASQSISFFNGLALTDPRLAAIQAKPMLREFLSSRARRSSISKPGVDHISATSASRSTLSSSLSGTTAGSLPPEIVTKDIPLPEVGGTPESGFESMPTGPNSPAPEAAPLQSHVLEEDVLESSAFGHLGLATMTLAPGSNVLGPAWHRNPVTTLQPPPLTEVRKANDHLLQARLIAVQRVGRPTLTWAECEEFSDFSIPSNYGRMEPIPTPTVLDGSEPRLVFLNHNIAVSSTEDGDSTWEAPTTEYQFENPIKYVPPSPLSLPFTSHQLEGAGWQWADLDAPEAPPFASPPVFQSTDLELYREVELERWSLAVVPGSPAPHSPRTCCGGLGDELSTDGREELINWGMITSHLPEVRLELIAPSQLCTDVDSTVLEHSGPDLPTPRQCAQNYRAQLNQLKRAGDLVIPERTVSLPEAAPPRPWFPLEWMSNLFAPQSPVSTPGEHNQVGPPAGVSFEEVTPINVWTEDPDFMTKIENLPYLQTFLQMSSNHPAPEPAVLEEEAVEPKVKTHFAIENVVALVDTFVEQCQDKDTREIFSYEHGKTNLAQTDDLVVQLFPHQQNKDDAFHKITVASRLVFSDPATNQRDIQRPETRTAGHELWLAFHRRMKLPSTKVPFSPELWEHATDHVERTYLSKSQANLENGRQRQDPDMPDPKIDLFIKSQWVKKLEKLGHTFKAGQTVSSFKQESIRRTAILATYMRLATEKFQPAHIFVNVRKTPADLARWVKENWNFTVDSDENDYTQFDKSQDEVTTVFEDLYHAHFSIPLTIETSTCS